MVNFAHSHECAAKIVIFLHMAKWLYVVKSIFISYFCKKNCVGYEIIPEVLLRACPIGDSGKNTDDDIFTYGGSLGVCYKLKNRHGWFFEPTLAVSYGEYRFYGDGKHYDSSHAAIELPIKFGHDFNLHVLNMTVSPLICIKPLFALGGHLGVDGVDYKWNPFNIAAGFGFGILANDKF